MNISICSYTFHQLTQAGVMDTFGYLESIKYRYGLTAADFWHGTFASLEESYLTKVKDALAERELTVANICIDRAYIWHDDPAVRESNAQNAVVNLKAAEYLGAQTVRIDAGGARDERTWNEQQFAMIVNQYRAWAQRAYDNGYRIGPENHWGAAMVPENIKKLCETVDHPGFGLLLHAARWHSDDTTAGDELVAPWVMHTHFSPTLSTEALTRTTNALRTAGYGGCYSVEVATTRYTEPALIIARLRDIGEHWRLG
ncbi:MAG: sugar phosphate isomerase/epimerase [Caldilinea sp. CFX5]|nr:sugar phosphate isomerase/epimerase [Caldilinea sp. CFX5]